MIIFRLIGYLLFFVFWMLFIPNFLAFLLMILMGMTEIWTIVSHDVPVMNVYFFFLSATSIMLYLSLRIKNFRRLYHAIPLLLPIFQMLFFTIVAIAFATLFLNLWAENELIPKGPSVFLATISVLLVRLIMSFWYRKYPIRAKEKDEDHTLTVQTYASESGEENDKKLYNKKGKGEILPGQNVFRTMAGLSIILYLFFAMSFQNATSTEEGMDGIEARSSDVISAGFTIDDTSVFDYEERDFEIGGFQQNTARILIWDFTGDSEDEVQILADGQTISETHTLDSNVTAYYVPVPSVVTIEGLEGDPGAEESVTYAVKFPERQETFFNTVQTGNTNHYHLMQD